MFISISVRNGILFSRWNLFSSLCFVNGCRNFTFSYPLALNPSAVLFAEPLKKKKRLDPSIIKARLERSKKKLEKEIRHLDKMKKCLKPIEETQIPLVLMENKEARRREVHVPEDIKEERILLLKEWNRVRTKYIKQERNTIQRLLESQNEALTELKLESEELYKAAIQIDTNLLPFSFKGPVETPPIEGYESPDGDYTDISRDWSKPAIK